ncbi:MAG: M1 family aminopeptidase, partial [Pyrinomonadaceae bacterium]
TALRRWGPRHAHATAGWKPALPLAIMKCLKLRPHSITHRRLAVFFIVVLFVSGALFASPLLASAQAMQTMHKQETSADTTRYQINLNIDLNRRNYTGTERVKWINNGKNPVSVLYFHLYANKHSAAAEAESKPNEDSATKPVSSDFPEIVVTDIRLMKGNRPLSFAPDERRTSLRIELPFELAPGASTEVLLNFEGSVPEIQIEETLLLTHITRQINAVLRHERETSSAREYNFASGNMMLLSTPYPVLAVRGEDDWQRKIEDKTIDEFVFTEAADYDVSIESTRDTEIIAPGEEHIEPRGKNILRRFTGKNLRDFAILASRGLVGQEKRIEGLRIVSYHSPEHQIIGRRLLDTAANAARVYTSRFGSPSYKTLNIVEAPLSAGLGSIELCGLAIIANAFYVDFDAPQMANLPDFVREQRTSVEDSLEFTTARVVAHQWWGAGVGNDPDSDPILDNALANWSALLYFRQMFGGDRAQMVSEDQLRGVYKIYRTFGGEDSPANRPAHEFKTSFQYSAIISSKGGLMFDALEKLLGEEIFFAALKNYYIANIYQIAETDDLRAAFVAEAKLGQRRSVTRLFNRWLSEKHGDEDVSPPDPQLAQALGINIETKQLKSDAKSDAKSGDRNSFARLGKFFWRQMTRLR